MSIVIALDASEWTGRLGRQHLELARALGVELFIAQLYGGGPTGTGPNDHAEEQLTHARAAGIPFVAGYIWVPPDDTTDTGALYAAARRAAGKHDGLLSFIAPDLEGGRLHPTDPPARLENLCKHVEAGGHPVVIYNRKSNWSTVMGPSVTQFSRYPLWEARYVLKSGYRPTTPPDIDWKWLKYGGWRQRAMLQYAGTAPVDGWSADWNVVDPARLGLELRAHAAPDIDREDEHMPTKEYEDVRDRIDKLAAAIGEVNSSVEALRVELRAHAQHVSLPGRRTTAPRKDRVYVVQPGDSLALIAKRLLGNAGRLNELVLLNAERYPGLQTNANSVEPGWQLRLPAE